MSIFLKAAALVLVAVILNQLLSAQGKHFGILLSILVCCGVCMLAMEYFQKVLELFRTLKRLGSWDDALYEILLKCVGIGILSEITTMICADGGNSAMGKAIGLLSGILMIWIALPLFDGVLTLIERLLGGV